MVDIKITEDTDLEDYMMIEGFSGGVGLVGTIAANYIAEKEDMEVIGHISSDEFPPVTPIHEGKPKHPIRIYKHPNKKICLLVGELIIPTKLVQKLSSKILDFVEENGIEEIISVGGMGKVNKDQSKNIYGIVSRDDLMKRIEDQNVELINQGIAMGVSGVLLAKAADKKYPATSLLAESRRKLPDPESAADIINVLNNILDMDINVSELEEKGKEIEKKTKKMVSKMKKANKKYKKAEDNVSSMYR